ncbi:hypothetical protein [Streptomyces sp. NBC_00198]|nr:hypothetical protein [Streptomyces sp. NBC_00198]MCX5285695.1 hypothetical protein [Streptomyces sp. NBC_00198]MCX5286203.1 hypothetical protein [Streptomyces sp. NBC_00198]
MDDLPLWLLNTIPDVAGLFDELRDDAREKAERDAERQASTRR